MGEFDGKKDESNLNTKPCTNQLEQSLERIIDNHHGSAGHHPAGMPHNAMEAAKWFISLIEFQKSGEGIKEMTTKTSKTYWAWPYSDRVISSLKLFYRQSPKMQTIIVAAKQDGVHWRGDTMKVFLVIIEENEKMRALGIHEYRIESRKRRHEYAKRIAAKGKPKYQNIEANRQNAMEHTGVE